MTSFETTVISLTMGSYLLHLFLYGPLSLLWALTFLYGFSSNAQILLVEKVLRQKEYVNSSKNQNIFLILSRGILKMPFQQLEYIFHLSKFQYITFDHNISSAQMI